MTDTDLLIQNLRRENEALRAELGWKQKEIELAWRHEMQWISVKDRLPRKWRKDGSSVSIYYLIYEPEFDDVDVGVYDGENDCWYSRGLTVTVTHWMPLPEKPKEINNGNKTNL